jgi:hypothetical protein
MKSKLPANRSSMTLRPRRGDEDIGGDGIEASELQLGIVLMRCRGLDWEHDGEH